MKRSIKHTLILAGLAMTLAPTPFALGATSAEQAALVKAKIQSLREECAQTRNQITITIESLTRLQAPGVELRPQFDKYKAELTKMVAQAKSATDRASTMKEKGEAFFTELEDQVKAIQNEDIRKEALNRLAKRKKSYEKILTAMQEAKEQLVPFMSDLNDTKILLETELTAKSVSSSKSLIKKANWHGGDANDSLVDVEKELDRMTAELATYQ